MFQLLFTISSSLWIIISTNNVGNPLPSPSQINGHISSIGKNHPNACHSRLPLTPIHQMQYIFPTIMLNNGWSNYHPPPGACFTRALWAHNTNIVIIHATLNWIIMIKSGHNFAHVMTCAKLWPDRIIKIIIITRKFFQDFNHELIKPL